MGNCLLTALPGACTNTALPKIGALRIAVSYRSGESVAPCPIHLSAAEDVTVNVNDGYFTDSEGEMRLTANYSVPASNGALTTIYPGNADFTLTFTNPHALTTLWIGAAGENFSDALALDLSQLRFITRLQSLSLDGIRVTGSLSALSAMRNLTSVSLSNTNVSGDLSALYACANLTTLLLANTSVTGDLAVLRRYCPNLQHVDVSGTAITNA